jgi:hypothetical protein
MALIDWLLRDSGAQNIREFHKNLGDDHAIYLKQRGYDGVIAGDEVVKFAPSAEENRVKMGAESGTVRAYHGTRAGSFDVFRPHIRKGEQLGFGIHFAADKELAARYATDDDTARRGKAPVLYTVELTMTHPLNADQMILEGSPEFDLARKLAGTRLMTNKNEEGVRCAWMQNAIDATSPARGEKLIREAGYDSVIYEFTIGGAVVQGYRSVSGKGTGYIVFDPGQIRIVDKEAFR